MGTGLPPAMAKELTAYATKRSLERVLDHHKCRDEKFNMSNTLMIDSEAIKIRDYLNNAITVKPYDIDEVLKP